MGTGSCQAQEMKFNRSLFERLVDLRLFVFVVGSFFFCVDALQSIPRSCLCFFGSAVIFVFVWLPFP